MVGGATRIPQVNQAAMDLFGRKTLDGALNGDEAAALGATLYAAKLSTSFRLREFGITDAYPYATSIQISGQGDAESHVLSACIRPPSIYRYATSIQISGQGDADGADDDADGGAPKVGKDKLLFKAATKMPHKKLITMTRVDDLIATLSNGELDHLMT